MQMVSTFVGDFSSLLLPLPLPLPLENQKKKKFQLLRGSFKAAFCSKVLLECKLATRFVNHFLPAVIINTYTKSGCASKHSKIIFDNFVKTKVQHKYYHHHKPLVHLICIIFILFYFVWLGLFFVCFLSDVFKNALPWYVQCQVAHRNIIIQIISTCINSDSKGELNTKKIIYKKIKKIQQGNNCNNYHNNCNNYHNGCNNSHTNTMIVI